MLCGHARRFASRDAQTAPRRERRGHSPLDRVLRGLDDDGRFWWGAHLCWLACSDFWLTDAAGVRLLVDMTVAAMLSISLLARRLTKLLRIWTLSATVVLHD